MATHSDLDEGLKVLSLLELHLLLLDNVGHALVVVLTEQEARRNGSDLSGTGAEGAKAAQSRRHSQSLVRLE